MLQIIAASILIVTELIFNVVVIIFTQSDTLAGHQPELLQPGSLLSLPSFPILEKQ